MIYSIKFSLFSNVDLNLGKLDDNSNPLPPNVVRMKKNSYIMTIDNGIKNPSTASEIKTLIKNKINLISIESDSLISNITNATFPDSSLVTEKVISYQGVINSNINGVNDISTKSVAKSNIPSTKSNIKKSTSPKKGSPLYQGPVGPTS
jgi:hypothetical protein